MKERPKHLRDMAFDLDTLKSSMDGTEEFRSLIELHCPDTSACSICANNEIVRTELSNLESRHDPPKSIKKCEKTRSANKCATKNMHVNRTSPINNTPRA